MPNYTFQDNNTGEQWTIFMSINDKEEFLEQNKHISQILTPVAFGDPIKMGIRKPDSNFRDVLKEIKKNHPRSKGVNTF